MTTLTETPRNWEFLVSENNGDFSREQFTLIAGQNLKASTILGKITASGKYTQHNTGAVDGSQNAIAILGPATDATLADKVTAGIIGGPGVSVEVNGLLLTYTIAISFPGVWPGSEEENKLGAVLAGNYAQAIDLTLVTIRKLVADAKI